MTSSLLDVQHRWICDKIYYLPSHDIDYVHKTPRDYALEIKEESAYITNKAAAS